MKRDLVDAQSMTAEHLLLGEVGLAAHQLAYAIRKILVMGHARGA